MPNHTRSNTLSKTADAPLRMVLPALAQAWEDLRLSVDRFVANSYLVARRIRKVYRRSADVIHPPVDIENFQPGSRKEDFYLTVGRMVPYKRIGMIVEAFAAMPDRKLVVIGNGPEFGKVKSKAGKTIELLGYQTTESLRDYMRRARAFVYAALEDFGIATVEAQACGTPVIAYGRGGSCEIVRPLGADRPTGVLFEPQTPEALVAAVDEFERNRDKFAPEVCRANAERFSAERFRARFSAYVAEAWGALQDELARPAGDAATYGHPGKELD